ncbi:MATE family efflux transporter [candidate division KSB1 bacterium]
MGSVTQKKQPSTLIVLLRTSFPAAIDLAIQPVLWAYEAVWIAQLGFASFCGYGLALNVILVVFTVLLTFVVGSSVIINWHLGRGDSWNANHILGQSVMLAAIMAVIFSASFYFGAPFLFKIIKEAAEPAAQLAGVQYLRTLSYFLPLIVINFVAIGIVRGVGDTHYSMMINLIVAGINFLLAPMLIFGTLWLPKLEVAGAAVAVGIAQSVGLVMTIVLLRSRKCKLYLSVMEMTTPKWESIKLLFKKGLPTTAEQLSWTLGMFFVSLWVARLGLVWFGTHQILLRVQGIMSMIYQGFGLSAMALVGKKIGADEISLAEKAGKQAGGIIFLLVLLMVILLTGFSDLILRIFTDDPVVLQYGSLVIRIFALVQIPKALNTVLTGNLRGAGELKFLMWNTLIAVLIFEISASAAVIFIFSLKLNAVWIVHGFDETARLFVNFFRFRNGKWKLQNV